MYFNISQNLLLQGMVRLFAGENPSTTTAPAMGVILAWGAGAELSVSSLARVIPTKARSRTTRANIFRRQDRAPQMTEYDDLSLSGSGDRAKTTSTRETGEVGILRPFECSADIQGKVEINSTYNCERVVCPPHPKPGNAKQGTDARAIKILFL